MAQPSQPGASPQRPAGTPVPPGPCTSEVSWPSCPAGWHLHTRTRMADGEGVTAEPTCPESASLCSANSLGVRQGTYRDQGLLGVRHQGCDRDVSWHKHSRHLRYPKPLVSHTANGSGARGCAGAGGWNESSEVSLGHGVSTSGEAGYCGGHWPGTVRVGCPHGCCAQGPEPTQGVTVPLPRCSDLGGGAHPKVTHSKVTHPG